MGNLVLLALLKEFVGINSYRIPAEWRQPRVDGFVIYEANIAGIPSYAYFWRGGKVGRLGAL